MLSAADDQSDSWGAFLDAQPRPANGTQHVRGCCIVTWGDAGATIMVHGGKGERAVVIHMLCPFRVSKT